MSGYYPFSSEKEHQDSLMGQWLDECCLGKSIDEGAYREDPFPTPALTVREAFDLQLLKQGVKLYIHRTGLDGESLVLAQVQHLESITPNRTYSGIVEGSPIVFVAEHLVFLNPQTRTEQVLFGLWMKENRRRIALQYPDVEDK